MLPTFQAEVPTGEKLAAQDNQVCSEIEAWLLSVIPCLDWGWAGRNAIARGCIWRELSSVIGSFTIYSLTKTKVTSTIKSWTVTLILTVVKSLWSFRQRFPLGFRSEWQGHQADQEEAAHADAGVAHGHGWVCDPGGLENRAR